MCFAPSAVRAGLPRLWNLDGWPLEGWTFALEWPAFSHARKELVLPCTYNTLNTGKQSRTDKAKSRTDKMRLHAAMHDRVGHHASAPRLTHSFRIAMATDLPSWKYPSRTDWRTLYERPGCIHAFWAEPAAAARAGIPSARCWRA